MEIVDKIRNIANIVDIASQYTTLRRRGRKHVGLCPFHSEKQPSFTVDDEKQLFHCFGCGIGGDVFSLVMEKENLSFPETLRYLAEKYNLELPETRKSSPKQRNLEEKLFKINEDTLAYFKKNLFNTSEGRKALEYLKKRNITEDTIQKLKIGYALNSYTALFDHFQRKDISASHLEKAGLVIPSQKKEGYYDRFRGRIIFPIFDLTGKVVGFGGRTVINAEPKYLNSPDTPVYTKGDLLYGLNFSKDSIRQKGEVILVEGYTDFIALFQNGITNIAASLGTSLTPNQVYLAFRFAPIIIVNYDSDSAGISAARRALPISWEKGAEVKILILPEELDPDSYLRKYGLKEYKENLRKSTPAEEIIFDFHLKEVNLEIPEQKVRAVRNIWNEIKKNTNKIMLAEYIKKLCHRTKIAEDTLRSIIKLKPADIKEEEKEKIHFLNAEKRLLQILMEDKNLAPQVFSEMKKEYYQGLKSEPIFSDLSESFKNGTPSSLPELKQKIDRSLFSMLSEALMEKEKAPTLEEALECLNTLRQYTLENQAKKLKEQIARIEREGEKEKLSFLIKQLQDIKNQLSSLSQRDYQDLSFNNRDSVTKERS
ncbi:MAG: DNA primase [Candidatus Aminicenantes bacterium]|nr:DNA primase [Candidatus Aminicenantes bacterium]